jgi:hypothetical protein
MSNQISKLIETYDISMKFTFVPFTESKNCKDSSANWFKAPNWPSLNWKVEVLHSGRSILHTDYRQGLGHIPGYKPSRYVSMFAAEVLSHTMQNGKVPTHQQPYIAKAGKMPDPKIEDVLYSLLLDGSADFDAQRFEDWCGYFGYDTDSRKAERIYGECLRTGQALRNALGAPAIDKLREAFRDY